MVAKERTWISLGAAVLMASALGCSASQTAPTQTGAQPHSAVASRTVQSLPAGFPQLTNPPTVEQMSTFLPEKISAADAKRLLVQIDPNKIVKGGNYHTQAWWGGYGWGGWRFRNYSLYGGYYPFSYYPYSYSSLLYYPYSSYYYPYYYNAGYYYPYSLYGYGYGSYSYPYLYNYSSLYYPYYWR